MKHKLIVEFEVGCTPSYVSDVLKGLNGLDIDRVWVGIRAIYPRIETVMAEVAKDGCQFEQQNSWGFGPCGSEIYKGGYCKSHHQWGVDHGIIRGKDAE